VRLYTPFLYHWARREGLQEEDAADLVQDVFAVLVEKLPTFRREPGQSFRRWLRTVLLNKYRDRCRRRAVRVAVPLPDSLPDREPDADWEEQAYRREVVARAAELIRGEFQPSTWEACWQFLSGTSAAEVAARLGVRIEVVYSAKCRVLRRLRQEVEGLLD
jgi:RNA polymerase sigma-70 factor (ECF subfamily)